MNNLNHTFFEEYKSLDKLCGQLYNMQYGMTCYIENMKRIPPYNYQNVPNWNDYLKQLIRLRHIRNYLAHEEGAFEKETCTQRDIEWIQNFHKCILNRSDPLAMLEQIMRTKNQYRRQFYINNRQQVKEKEDFTNNFRSAEADKEYENKRFSWLEIISVIAIAVGILGIIAIIAFYM